MKAWIKKNKLPILIALSFVTIAASAVLVSIVLATSLTSSNDVCHAIRGVDTQLTNFLSQQAGRVGQKGTAGYAYYHNHPDLKRQAQQAYAEYLAAFTPPACP